MKLVLLLAFIFLAAAPSFATLAAHRVPTAANITVSTPASTPVAISLSQGSSGRPTSARIIGSVVGGSVKLNGLIAVFTPAGGCLKGTFTYALSNRRGESNPAIVTVIID